MLFNSAEFVFFFTGVYFLYRLLNRSHQNWLLLAASYVFYGSWDWRFLLLLWASTIIDYFCGLQIGRAPDPARRKSWLILSLCVNLGILGFFKYFNFFYENVSAILQAWHWPAPAFVLKVILPVGVSFYTFQSISYILDVYSKKIDPEKNFWDYALFVAFFPQLVAGPIERAGHMLPQYQAERVITAEKTKEGIWFIAWGFFLKIFVADNMARLADLVFHSDGPLPGLDVILGAYAFAFQVFGDFAGYSFIALGAARLLGIDLAVNFLFPYFVTNPRDFWGNWHMSLSAWLRNYLYIPLGGNRKGRLKTYRNLMMTMFLGGLWHGAAWTFVLWGVYQGLTLVVHRAFRSVRPPQTPARPNPMVWGIKVLLMFQVTCFGWLIFRASSLKQLGDWCRSLLLNLGAPSDRAPYLASQIVFYSTLALAVQILQKRRSDLMAVPKLSGLGPWLFYAGMLYSVLFFGEFGGKQFIYFQF